MRCEGWLRGVAYWPHWIVMGFRATPRYWIYEAGGHLFARLNEYIAVDRTMPSATAQGKPFESDLPLWLSGTRADAADWRSFARISRLELPQISRGNSRMTATEQISAPVASPTAASTLAAQPLQRPSLYGHCAALLGPRFSNPR